MKRLEKAKRIRTHVKKWKDGAMERGKNKKMKLRMERCKD